MRSHIGVRAAARTGIAFVTLPPAHRYAGHDTNPSGRRRYGRGGLCGRCNRCAENPRTAADLGERLGQWGWMRWYWYRTPADLAAVRNRCGWIVKEFLSRQPAAFNVEPPCTTARLCRLRR